MKCSWNCISWSPLKEKFHNYPISIQNLQKTFLDTLVHSSCRNECCFHMSFFPELPTMFKRWPMKRAPRSLESFTSELRQEIPSQPEKSVKIGSVRYLMNRSNPFLVNFFAWCQTFPWSGKQHLPLLKKVVADFIWNKLVITGYIKINKSRALSETFCGGLEFGWLWEQKHYIYS